MAIKTIDMSSCPCCDPCKPYPDYIELAIEYGSSVASNDEGDSMRLPVNCDDILGSCYTHAPNAEDYTATIRLNSSGPGSNSYYYYNNSFYSDSSQLVESAYFYCTGFQSCGYDSQSILLRLRYQLPRPACLPLDASGNIVLPEGYCCSDPTALSVYCNLPSDTFELCLRKITRSSISEDMPLVCRDTQEPINLCCHPETITDLVGISSSSNFGSEFYCIAGVPIYMTKAAWERATARTWDNTAERPFISNPPCEDIVFGMAGIWFMSTIVAVVKATVTPHYPDEA